MKRVFTILICLAMMQTGSYAQSFFKGSNVISAGIGLGGSLGSFSSEARAPPSVCNMNAACGKLVARA
jgi:hypothetical protein